MKDIFKGSDYFKNLTLLAVMAKESSKKEGGSAGGLASGFFILNMMKTANVVSGGLFAAKAWVMAKSLNSKAASKWLTNEPLKVSTRKGMQAATASMLIMSSEETGADLDKFEKKVIAAMNTPGGIEKLLGVGPSQRKTNRRRAAKVRELQGPLKDMGK